MKLQRSVAEGGGVVGVRMSSVDESCSHRVAHSATRLWLGFWVLWARQEVMPVALLLVVLAAVLPGPLEEGREDIVWLPR